ALKNHSRHKCFCCFFFQAEDGIRDFHVTGVQTCALPIWGDGVDGGGEFVDDVAHDVDPLGREQHGPHLVPGVLGPADDLLALGDEESLGGVAPAAHVGGGPARGAGAAGGGGGRDAGGRRP